MKHRSGNVAVQETSCIGGIKDKVCNEFVPFWAMSSRTGKHGNSKSFETQIINSVERITRWQEQLEQEQLSKHS